LGIIGQNGSGKSTLLQIICSVLQPTEGKVVVNGRISALLELGAGFNPEFTGRENVVFNGAVMGISTEEMADRLPKIESFADIGDFIDQPVKIYSSGMFARLAFATAINIDPDILVVDEALSVGDAKFQHKCYQKFRQFQDEGKTILFVSHDTNAVLKNCNHAVLLEKGKIVCAGSPKEVTRNYQNLILTGSTQVLMGDSESLSPLNDMEFCSLKDRNEFELKNFLEEVHDHDKVVLRRGYNKDEYRYGDGRSEIIDCMFVCEGNIDPVSIFSGEKIDIYLKIRFLEDVERPAFGFSLKTVEGVLLYANNTRFAQMNLDPVQKSEVVVMKFSLPMNLHAGEYFFDFGSGEKVGETGVPLDFRFSVIHLTVLARTKFDGLIDLTSEIVEVSKSSFASLKQGKETNV